MNNYVGMAVSYAFVFLVIFLGRFFERFGKEVSRKFIHVAVGNWWLIGMLMFDNRWLVSIVPGTFVILNYLSYRFTVFKSMERSEGRGDLGTVYYAVSLLVLSVLTLGGDLKSAAIGGTGIFAMAYGDGFAAVFGKRFPSRSVKIFGSVKSVAGTLAMVCFSFAGVFVMLSIGGFGNRLAVALAAAIAAVAAEFLTPLGFDNLTVPLLVSGLTALLV